jgi:hypothetical protein
MIQIAILIHHALGRISLPIDRVCLDALPSVMRTFQFLPVEKHRSRLAPSTTAQTWR